MAEDEASRENIRIRWVNTWVNTYMGQYSYIHSRNISYRTSPDAFLPTHFLVTHLLNTFSTHPIISTLTRTNQLLVAEKEGMKERLMFFTDQTNDLKATVLKLESDAVLVTQQHLAEKELLQIKVTTHHTLSTHPVNTSYQYTLSMQFINILYELILSVSHTLLTRPVNSPCHRNLPSGDFFGTGAGRQSPRPLTHPIIIIISYQHILPVHPFLTPYHHNPLSHTLPQVTSLEQELADKALALSLAKKVRSAGHAFQVRHTLS